MGETCNTLGEMRIVHHLGDLGVNLKIMLKQMLKTLCLRCGLVIIINLCRSLLLHLLLSKGKLMPIIKLRKIKVDRRSRRKVYAFSTSAVIRGALSASQLGRFSSGRVLSAGTKTEPKPLWTWKETK